MTTKPEGAVKNYLQGFEDGLNRAEIACNRKPKTEPTKGMNCPDYMAGFDAGFTRGYDRVNVTLVFDDGEGETT